MSEYSKYTDAEIEEWTREDLLNSPLLSDKYLDTKDIAVSCFKQMKTNEEILDAAAIKASEILGVPHTHLDKTMFLYFFTLLHEQFGGDEELMRHWIDTYNKHLNFCPGVQLTDNVTLNKVIAYLESFNK